MELDAKAIGTAVGAALLGLTGGGVAGSLNADAIHAACQQEKREMRDFFLDTQRPAGLVPAVYTLACPPIPCADRPSVCSEVGCGTCNMEADRCE